jgi:hypothetical protein
MRLVDLYWGVGVFGVSDESQTYEIPAVSELGVYYPYSASGTGWAVCAYISGYDISNAPSSENLGVVSDNSTYYAYGSASSNPVADNECTFTTTNNGSGAIDLDMQITDFTTGTTWNIVSGSPGSNEVRITAYYSGQDPASGLVLANTVAEFYDALAASGHIHWDFKIETGVLAAEASIHAATITITATAED